MKYKNQLIIGSSILVIILAVFIGVRLSGNTNSTLGKGHKEIESLADDGILDESIDKQTDEVKENDKIDEQETDKNTDSSMLDDADETDEADKEITEDDKTDKTDKTDKKVDDLKEGTEEKSEPEVNDQNTSKSEDKDGKTGEELEKETMSKQENVVYVFKNKYVVQPKETLSDVVKKCLLANKLDSGNSVYFDHAQKLITKINNISDPNLIITGSQMVLPTKANFKGLVPNGEAYRVKTGDTIHGIVNEKMKWCEYYKAKELLMENNGINNENEIKAGITLYIPTEDSEV